MKDTKYKYLKRFLALVLSAAIIITYMPTSLMAYASDETNAPATTEQAAKETKAEETTAPEAKKTTAPETADQQNAAPAANEEAAPESSASEEAAPEAEAEPETPAETPEKAEAEEAVPEEETFPAQSFNANKGGVKVLVKAPKGALPEGTEMVVTPANTKAVEQAVSNAVDGEVTGFKAVDITFVKDGKDIEPQVPVQVYLNASGLDKDADKAVVHIADNGSAEVVDNATVNSSGIAKVVTDQFSIYAIVETGEDARLKVVFKNGSEEIASMYVKKADDVNAIVYDPGVGELDEGQVFKGWTTVEDYTVDTEAINIDGVRSTVRSELNKSVTDGQELVFHALVLRKYVVDFLDDRDVTINTYSYVVKEGTNAEHAINEGFTPASNKQNFEGWKVEKGSENIVGTVKDDYQNGEKVSIKGDVTFKADAPFGEWLVFDENGKGATYNAPQFVKSGETTQKPVPDNQMVRNGYKFGGWYEDEACTTAFTFGKELNEGKTIYAKWTPNATANYTVIIWKQSASDAKDAADSAKSYDFAESVTLTGNVNQAATGVTSSGSGNNAYATVDGTAKRYTGFHLNKYDQNVTVTPEGSAIVNVYYDRNLITLTFNTVQSGRWRQYKQFTGLYGSSLADNKYVWPSEYNWYDDTDSWGNPSGTRTTFMDAFIPPNGGDSMTFYGANPSGDATIHFLKQDPNNSSSYNEVNTVSAGVNGSFYISDKYNGYEAYQYSTNGRTWNSVGKKDSKTGYYNGGEAVSYYGNLYIRFNCKKYNILYDDGVYVDGNGNPVEGYEPTGTFKEEKNVVYGSNLSDYNKNGSKYYEPTAKNAGFVFAGWYSDDACTHPYTFTTMPEGINVYAKWVQAQYRVFLHSGLAEGADDSLTWGSETQATNFRVSNGGKVSCPTGRRDEYDFVGWYKDSGCTQAYNPDTILNDTTVTSSYDKTKDMTDPWTKYGNDTATSNEDTDRFWITKKYDLYAKWRATIDGAKGITVVYDANEGSNAPADAMYLDSATAIVGAAATAPKGKQFDHWELQKYVDGEFVKDKDVLPGDNFTVLKANAERKNDEGWTEEEPKYVYTIKLVAVYKETREPVGTTITYDPNGGSGSQITENLLVNEGKTAKAANTFTKANYVFDSWNTEPDGSGLKVEAGSNISADLRDLVKNTNKNTLYAQWIAEIEVDVTGSTKSVPYNGSEQKNSKYTVKYKVGGVETTTLPQGITAEITAKQGGQPLTEIAAKGTDEGTYTATVTATLSGTAAGYTIKTAKDSDDVVLTITQNEAAITVTPADADKVYDGKALTKNEAKVTGVPEGFTYEVTTKGSITDVGTADNEVDTFKILKDGEDVTAQFSNITKGTGTLEVTKRTVTLTSETASKPYDGTALTRPEVTVGGDSFVDGEVSDIKATGTITEVGSVTNTITYTEGEKFKADNYTITKSEGTLTITQNEDEIVVVPGNGTKVYDGTALTQDDADEATVTGLPKGYTAEVTTEGTITNVGTADNVVTKVVIKKDGKDVTSQFKNINTEAKGTLEVTKRPVTLTSETAGKPYDGTALTRPEVTVGGDGFVDGEVSDIKATGTITEVGSVTNTITYTEGEKFKADNYEITKKEGTLTITQSEAAVTVTPADADKVYDGEALTKNEAEVTGVPEGFTYEVTTKGTITDVGTADNEVDTFKILKDGKDVTDQFKKITKNKGTLEVTKRAVTLTSETASKPYDGTALTKPAVTVTGDGFVDGEVSDIKATGTITEVGSVTNTITYTEGEKFKADNYEITKKEGTLTITQSEAAVTVTPADADKVYDGEALTKNEAEVTGVPEGFTYEVTTKGSITDVGTADNEVDTFKILKDGKDVTDQFKKITKNKGTLEVTKRAVTLTSETASKAYDGTALTKPEVTVTGDGFVDGEVSDIKATGTITEVGSVTNTITYTEGETFKADNYEIKKTEGTLTITQNEAAITVTPASDSRKYDGTPLTKNEAKVTGVPEGFTYEVTTKGSVTNVGTAANEVDTFKILKDGKDVTDQFSKITKGTGTLEVTKRAVTLTSETASKPYDGTALTKPAVTVTGDGFVDGEVSDIKATGTITEVGSVTNTITYTEGKDFKSDNYTITKDEGTLTITQNEDEIVVVPANGNKVYDGEALTKNEATVTGVPEGFTYEVTTKGSITDVGTADNEVDTFKVLKDGKDVTGQFKNINTEAKGTLTVTKRPVTLTSESASKPYDGTALTRPEVTVGGDGFVEGEVSDIKATGTITKVGSADNTITYTEGEKFKAGNYEITKTEGTLTITKSEAAITVTPADAEKVYDGEALTKNEAEVTGVPEGFTYEVTTKGSVTDAGKADNEVDTFKILKDGDDVTDQFASITKNKGTLEVTKRPATITSASAEKSYDGEPLTKHEVTVDGFVEGEGLSEVKVTGTQTYVGSSDNTFEYKLFGDNIFRKLLRAITIKDTDAYDPAAEGVNKTTKADNYDITVKYGTLTVTDEGVDIDDVTTKTHEDKEYKLGETVTFTIEVTNIYDKVKTITVTEQEGVKITSDSVFKDVKPGEKVTATAEYVVTEEDILAGSFNNTATVKFSDVDKPYEPEDKVDVEDPKGHVTITKVATSKPANGKAYKTGEKVTYKITVTNDGNISVKDVEVRDDLTGDVWNVDSIAPGKSEVFNAVYTVTKEDAKKGSVSNIATATGTTDDPDNPNPTIVPGKTTVTTDVPEEPATGGKGVKTGDDNNIPGAIGGFFASLAALFGAVYVRRRKNSEE